MPGGLPRREVLRGGLVSVAAALGHLPGCAAGPPAEEPFTPPGAGGIPRRILGNTGIEIPLVGLGTAILSGGIGTTMDDQELESTAAIVSQALDLGMNYIDTASAYGEVQRAVGLALQGRREDAFLVTKLWADSAEQAEAQLSSSLADLGTDFVDLLYLHDLGERNLDLALGPGGAWEFILQQKAAGVARLVGATGHHLPERMTGFIGRGEADVVMTPINYVDVHTYNFEQAALQPAREQGMGFLAMKVFGGAAGGGLPG